MPIRVLITDDHPIISESLSLLISGIPDVEVAGTLNDSRQVLTFLELHQVDVLITDYNMPYLSGIDLTLHARAAFPELRILMLTVAEDIDIVKQAFQAGITGYVMKKARKEELAKALATVASGSRYFGDDVMKALLASDPEKTFAPAPPPNLAITTRELEIIKLIAGELSTNEIAEKLSISAGTVETHRHNILRKLNVRNAIGIIKYAMQHQLI